MREYMRLVDARNLKSGDARRLVDEANAHIQAAYANLTGDAELTTTVPSSASRNSRLTPRVPQPRHFASSSPASTAS